MADQEQTTQLTDTGVENINKAAQESHEPDSKTKAELEAEKAKVESTHALIMKYVRSEADIVSYQARHYPRTAQLMERFVDRVSEIIYNFLMDDLKPIREVSKEEIEASIAGFWEARAKSAGRKRTPQQ